VAPRHAPSTGTDRPLNGTETIMVVEDEEPVRSLARRLLTAKGYTVLTAASGPDALAQLAGRSGTVHLLLTDVVMPGMGGRQLAERLRLDRPDIKVLFVSGYSDNDVLERGVVEPGAPFLPKPFTAEALLLQVRDVLDG
jgi:CheY-like chemotaxis protein